MMKKVMKGIAIIVILVSLLTLITGCGEKKEDNQNKGQSNQQKSSTETTNNKSSVEAVTFKDSDGKEVTVTKSNVSKYYGELVKYKANDNDTKHYQLFYIDFDNKYGDGAGTIYLRTSTNDGKVDFKTIIENYKDDNRVIEMFKKMNPKWSQIENQSINTNNEKAAAYLLDTNNWKNYVNENANYAIGAASLEMYIDSFNEAISDKKLDCLCDKNGYKYSADDGKTWANYTESDSLTFDNNNMYADTHGTYIFSSPSAGGSNRLCAVDWQAYNPNYTRGLDVAEILNTNYASPVVSIKSGVVLQFGWR